MNPLRLILLSIAFALCLGAVLTEHFLLAVPRRAHYLASGRKMAMLQQEFFPPRARLLAEDGTPLAWSERYFDLLWREPVPPDALMLRRIEDRLGERPAPEVAVDGRNWILCMDLAPEQLLRAAPLLELHPALEIRPRLERIVVDLPELQEKIGKVAFSDGALRGVSGWEKEFDSVLLGTPGRFEVMLDRRRHWINSSWKLLTPAVPGEDVRVPWKLNEEDRP